MLAVSAPGLFGAAVSGPVVNNGTINYQTNQVTLIGSGFEPTKVAPTVVFSSTTLSVVSASNNQVVATLPAGVSAGTFSITVTEAGGASTLFDLTYGATGPQGLVGPQGAAGAKASAAGATSGPVNGIWLSAEPNNSIFWLACSSRGGTFSVVERVEATTVIQVQ